MFTCKHRWFFYMAYWNLPHQDSGLRSQLLSVSGRTSWCVSRLLKSSWLGTGHWSGIQGLVQAEVPPIVYTLFVSFGLSFAPCPCWIDSLHTLKISESHLLYIIHIHIYTHVLLWYVFMYIYIYVYWYILCFYVCLLRLPIESNPKLSNPPPILCEKDRIQSSKSALTVRKNVLLTMMFPLKVETIGVGAKAGGLNGWTCRPGWVALGRLSIGYLYRHGSRSTYGSGICIFEVT